MLILKRFYEHLFASRVYEITVGNGRRPLFGAIAICIVVAAITLISAPLVFTGDEPRFAYAAVSFWERGDFSLAQEDWDIWLANQGIDYVLPADKGTHSLFHSLFLSIVAGPFGLEAARWAQLLPLFVGIFALLTMAGSGAKCYTSYAYVALLCLAVPMLPYSHLLYGEIWLFAGVSIVIAAMNAPKLNCTRVTIVILALSTLMFVHIRSTAIVFVLGLALLYQLVVVQRISKLDLLKLSVPIAVIVAIWVAYQFKMSGELLTASAPYTPSFELFFERLNVQLFGTRHGLLFYAPAALIGVAGLVLGVMKRDVLVSFCLIALCVYAASIVWGTASESYSGRFWVCAMPLIIYGGIYWFRNANLAAYIVAVVPILWTLVTIYLYVEWSEGFLHTGVWSVPYARLYEFTSLGINLAQFGAIEPESFGLRSTDTLARPYEYQIYCMILLTLLCLAPLTQLRTQIAVVLTSIMAATAFYQQASISAISGQIRADHMDGQNRPSILITLPENTHVKGIKFGNKDDPVFWPYRPFPEYLDITAIDNSGNHILVFRSNAVPFVRFPYKVQARTIRITATSDSLESVANLSPAVAVN